MQPSPRADEIYRSGPETLIAAAPLIVAGPIADLKKQVTEKSQPDGLDQVPLRWTASGRIQPASAIKGKFPGTSVDFVRAEQSLLLPPDAATFKWETSYGELSSRGRAVAFLGNGNPFQLLRVVPSGDGELDLAGLIVDLVSIQALDSPGERQKKWLAYFNSSPTDEGRKAALRTLVGEPVAWPDLEPVLTPFLKNASRSAGVRGFAFGIVAWAITEGKWPDQQPAAVRLLGKTFEAEADPRLATQQLLALGQIMTYCANEDFRQERKPLRDLVVASLQARPSLTLPGGPPARPDLEKTYVELRTRILAR